MEILLQKIAAGIVGVAMMVSGFFGYHPENTKVQENTQVPQELGAFNTTGGGTYRLRSSVSTTDSTLQLSSFKEPVSNLVYTMSYLNATILYGTVEPQTTRSEFISFTGITQNTDGTASLTGVTRGLTRTPAGSTCTASTTLAQRHPAQSTFIISDSPCYFAEYAVKRNDETVTGQWAFPYPSSSNTVATKGYVDTVALGSPTVAQIVVTATAGETVRSGQIVFYDRYIGEWLLADADTASTTQNVLLGVAQGAGTDGVAISGGVLLHGVDTYQGGMRAGQQIFISSTAGATSTVSRGVGRLIGMARTATNLYFDPTTLDLALTGAGSTTPTSVNRYETQISIQTSTSTYAVDSGSTDAYAINLTPAPTGYVAGLRAVFKATTANASTSTLNINGLGAQTLKKFGTIDLQTGDIKANQLVEVVYDGTNFQVVSPISNSNIATSTGLKSLALDSSNPPTPIIASTTIPAGILGTYGGFRITGFYGSNTCTPTVSINLLMNSTHVFATTTDVQNSHVVKWTLTWMNTGSAASQQGQYEQIFPDYNTREWETSQFTSTVDTASDITLGLIVRRNTGAACTLPVGPVYVEILK